MSTISTRLDAPTLIKRPQMLGKGLPFEGASSASAQMELAQDTLVLPWRELELPWLAGGETRAWNAVVVRVGPDRPTSAWMELATRRSRDIWS